jgi:hypothetical protein
VSTEVQPAGLFKLVSIVDEMTGEDKVHCSFLGIFGHGKAYVASDAYDDETTECSKPQLDGNDPFPIRAGDELVTGMLGDTIFV